MYTCVCMHIYIYKYVYVCMPSGRAPEPTDKEVHYMDVTSYFRIVHIRIYAYIICMYK